MDSEFYCNPCHKQLCRGCKEEHLKSLDFIHHDIVSLLQHQPTYLAENCTIHTTSAIISFCDNCLVPLCFKCAASSEHKGHNFVNLRTTYAEKFDICSKRISNIKDHLLPSSRARQNEIATGFAEVKNSIASLRMSVVVEASELKEIVNKIVLENMGKLDNVEEKLLKDQETQSTDVEDYISNLEDLVDRYDVNLADKTLLELVALDKNTMGVKDFPHLPSLPILEFVPGQVNRTEISAILGSIRITENDNCKVATGRDKPRKPSIFSFPSLHNIMNHRVENNFRLPNVVGSIYQFSLVKTIVVSDVENILHISLDKLNKLWVSDLWGSLEQIDINGKVHKNLIANIGEHGFHAVTDDDDFLYTDQSKRVVNKVRNEKTTQLISTERWTPLSICFSRINGDVLVGMVKDHQGKITRFTGAGIKVNSIQFKSYLQNSLYEYPNYITESVNGDICASDSGKEAVVVVNKSGKHHFSYKGQKPKFIPYGICTDIHGYIMVCDGHRKNVHLLDPDGQFLFLILTTQEHCPQGLCVDDQYNLYVGQGSTNEITVYRYNR
ncbi:uncharacterized protein LOC134242133 [Saccostrea cucullata]|uniref:uncharacterized protein LOC134242133 n=1 Tax=Saccostrea cuccullata TaxID=36930 RepID=UPI002ED1104F